MTDEMKCCQIDGNGKACSKKAVAVHRNKPLCSKCFLGTMKYEQDSDRRRKYNVMTINATGMRDKWR